MNVDVIFQDLVPFTAAGAPSGTTASHIHCCTATPGYRNSPALRLTTPTFEGFPLGVMGKVIMFIRSI